MIFDDLKVLELATVLAGPGVGQFFAELGAEVIKVENLRTQGDITRTWKIQGEQEGDLSAYFCSVNWGKKSIALDLSQSEGKIIVRQLAAQADVVIASYKPGDAVKLGVDYDTLSKDNKRILYGSITGYGPLTDRVGYDAVIQAEAGFMFLNGEKTGPPVKMPVALIDILAGHQLKEGLLVAMLKRERTGIGELVEVSLIQSAVASLANQASNWLVAKKLPQRQGSAHPNIAPYGESFETADGKRILLAVGSDRQFADLCKVLDLPELVLDPRYETNQKRVEYRAHLDPLLSRKISSLLSEELMTRMNAYKIPAGIIQDMHQVFEMPEARGLLIHSNALVGVKNFVANPDHPVHLLPPPHFGEHSTEILDKMGYSATDLDRLRQAGIIPS